MGAFDKKKAFGIGGIITVIGAIGWGMNFVADYYQAKEGFEKSKNPVTTTSVVETVEKTTKATKAEQEDVIEVNAVEQAELETEPPTEPPTEPQPTAVYLDSLKVAESNNFYEDEKNITDTVGNTYINHILTVGEISYSYDYNDSDYDYAMYYLGGKYKTLSGTIAVNDISLNKGDGGEISILCDDEIAYTTGQVSRAFAPTEVSINVENCQWLKIWTNHYKDDTNWSQKYMNFILSNFKLE